MPLSELQRIRLAKALRLREQGIEPYPSRSERTHTSAAAIQLFEMAESGVSGELTEDGHTTQTVTVAGRIIAIRDMGRSLFAPIRDAQGEIQLYLRKNIVGNDAFEEFSKTFDLGDFVEATGELFRTRTGEVTVRVQRFVMLAKALNAPPEKWHGLTDVETRYRRRYADLIANAEVRQVFVNRAKIIRAIRRVLDDAGYLEVETPTLQPIYGGAMARPFTTYHHALDQTLYLRIADELYLKRLIVGGYERVYEICKDFRNEGIDKFHSPEFTMLEFYAAYADYEDMMMVVEQLILDAALAVHGGPSFTYQGQQIDLTPPWPRKTLRAAIRDETGIDYVEFPEQPALLAAARQVGADIESDTPWPKIVDELLKQFVRPKLIQPIFLYDYPVSLSPLAKRKADDPSHVERFQLFIGGIEAANSFTELNDPMDQLARFRSQQREREAGDEETMPIDADYINALMFGMPPTGGVGIGIDRLTMLLTDQETLRDVILFPTLRKLPPEADPVMQMLEGVDPVAEGWVPPIEAEAVSEQAAPSKSVTS